MTWQDIAIAVAQATFIMALIPAIRKHSTLPLATTATSTLAAILILVAVWSLGFWLSAIIGSLKTAMWGILAWQSYQAEKKPKR